MAKKSNNQNFTNEKAKTEQNNMKDVKIDEAVKADEVENVQEENAEAKKLTPLEIAQKEAAEYKDMALRRMAELENYRRNNKNLAGDVRERTIMEVLRCILPALDGFHRADELIPDEKTKEGVKIIHDQMMNALSKYEVTPIDAVGQDFDPELHECIMQVENPKMVGKVIYEIEKGYKMGDKILRFSRVAVGKDESQNDESQN